MRLFFALQPTPEQSEAMLAQVAPLFAAPGIPAIPATNMHATLCFLGAVAEEKVSALRAAAAHVRSRGVSLSFDTTGSPRVARGAIDAASVRGTVLVCGAPPPGTEISVDIQGILSGKVLRGVTMGDTDPATLIPRLIALHAEGKLPLERIEKRYTLDEIARAADDMHHGVTVKPVIVF